MLSTDYGRLGELMDVIHADKRYRVRESSYTGLRNDIARRTVEVYGPITPDAIEHRLPAPSDLVFRRWSENTVNIGDPDNDPAVRPQCDVLVMFYPPLRWWDARRTWDLPHQLWSEPVETRGDGGASTPVHRSPPR